MTLAQLNAKISKLPFYPAFDASPCIGGLDRNEARYLRDERLGILCGSAEPTEEQVQIVHDQLFGQEPQGDLL